MSKIKDINELIFGKQTSIGPKEDPYLPSTGRTIKYRYVFTSGGHLDSKGEDVIECKDCIIAISPEAVKESFGYDPTQDLWVSGDSDLKGIKDIIATG